ncbi:MAG: ASCH domain-containing protein [Nostoc sp.]|uniref:ASCH domain-containing protein n=1 Tax=Nostoc sp. TaxID=1180 RepID=UPI002FF7AE7B
MKALSVRQPWAWAIIYALKDIENRGWPINYRGDILIHAAKTCTKKEYQSAREFCQGMGVIIPELISLLPVRSFFLEFEKLPKNRKSRSSNGFSHSPKFTLNYHPVLKTLFLCDAYGGKLRAKLGL